MADGVNTFGQAEGGAIFTGTAASSGVPIFLTISNSIVAGNEAIGGSGGSTLVFPRPVPVPEAESTTSREGR